MIYANNFVICERIYGKAMNIPTNPDMLVSFINMKLRNNYDSLESLCDDMDINIDELVQNLRNAGFEYSPQSKRFF